MTLTWNKIIDVDGYHITPRAPTLYPALKTIITMKNEIEVTKLAPGINYTFEVGATKKNYVGKSVMITAATKGLPLPSVIKPDGQLVKPHGTTVKLTWDPPKSSRKIKWQYAVYYGLNMHEMIKEYKYLTTNMTATIKDLEACEKYLFGVGVYGDYGAGPLSLPVTVTTLFNVRASPKNVRVTLSNKSDSIIVSWSASCPMIDEPIRYTITLVEMVRNKTTVVTLVPTTETIMKHTFNNIRYGGKYCVTVATDFENSIPSLPVIYQAPPIFPPHQLKVLYEGGNYIIYWQESPVSKSMTNITKYHYEILVAEGARTLNESNVQIFKADQPPYIYKDAKSDVIYTFAVRLVTDDGYRSILSETRSVESSTAWPVIMSTSNILSLAIPICLLVIALGSALAYLVVRHRRLSNSFTQFANSHYDTRRGQATFPGTTDGLEEEDSPVIRGFSDDEPLVIA